MFCYNMVYDVFCWWFVCITNAGQSERAVKAAKDGGMVVTLVIGIGPITPPAFSFVLTSLVLFWRSWSLTWRVGRWSQLLTPTANSHFLTLSRRFPISRPPELPGRSWCIPSHKVQKQSVQWLIPLWTPCFSFLQKFRVWFGTVFSVCCNVFSLQYWCDLETIMLFIWLFILYYARSIVTRVVYSLESDILSPTKKFTPHQYFRHKLLKLLRMDLAVRRMLDR